MSDVLVVEDDPDVSWALVELLESEGHVVRAAEDGMQGLRCLAERLPDVVLLDVEMPRLTGPEMAYRMFVNNLGMENVPIVLVSGVAGLRDLAGRIGTPYFLPKPFDLHRLLDMVARALRERELPRPCP